MIKVSPSILAADQLNLERDVQRMVEAGCDFLHVDVMDAHFVPNLSFSPATVKALHQRFPNLPLDVHLMMDNPAALVREFAQAGAWGITIHAEAEDAEQVLKTLRDLGVKVGLSIKPNTSVESIQHLLPYADLLLVMTVEPGFGGQSFQPQMVEKLRKARTMGFAGLLETDGGVTLDNLPTQAEAGLDIAVMGTAMFRSKDAKQDMDRAHQL